jgi:RNA polymerase sigma factor (sigma-70 family)
MKEFPGDTPNESNRPAVSPVNPPARAELPMSDSKEHFIEQAMADYESPLLGYASTILHDLDRARDVVQDTFIRLCQQDIPKVRDNLKSWLFTVCRNRALDLLRKDKNIQPIDEIRWQRIAGPDLPPDQQFDQDERFAQVMKYLDRLSPTNGRSSSSNSTKASATRKSPKSPASPPATSASSSTPASNASANSSPPTSDHETPP